MNAVEYARLAQEHDIAIVEPVSTVVLTSNERGLLLDSQYLQYFQSVPAEYIDNTVDLYMVRQRYYHGKQVDLLYSALLVIDAKDFANTPRWVIMNGYGVETTDDVEDYSYLYSHAASHDIARFHAENIHNEAQYKGNLGQHYAEIYNNDFWNRYDEGTTVDE